ncbi:MAG: heparinase II/III family protein [Clostridia bacterium]|nr:heparinase II/III family protein [Clostridia bacterium]
MFSEYLDRHSLRELLIPGRAIPFPPADDRAAWARVPEKHAREIREMAKAYAAQPYPMRKATDFLAFVRTGSRAADEGPYFLRRRKLCAAALLCCVDAEAPLDDVIDGIWCICEESSWVISAHNVNPIPGAPAARDYPLPDTEKPYIDLFSAQTGMILSLVRHLLRSRLDAVTPEICRRMEREVARRILTPFMETDDFWWMGVRRKDLCNWTPWIISNVMLCACVWRDDRDDLAALLDRACRMLDRWLDVVPPDGGCDEGAGYWNMAGGALLDCLERLEQATGGSMTFWGEEKIRNIMTFPLKAEIGGGWFVNFADCDAQPYLSGERLQYAGERLGDAALAAMGNRLRGRLCDPLNDVPHFSRVLNLLFHPEGEAAAGEPRQDVWLPDLQLRLVRRGALTLCCKGGHNGESHNHNDVGSFMLYADQQPVIVDAGNMNYTAKTFSDERYTLWNVRGAYHNLPLIGGREQQPGREHAAREVECLPDGLALDLAGAYGKDAGVKSLRREMTLKKDGFFLRDRIALETPAVAAWVFMLRKEPDISAEGFASGDIRVQCPPGLTFSVEEIPVEDARMARNFPGSLWRLIAQAPASGAFDAKFTVTERNR